MDTEPQIAKNKKQKSIIVMFIITAVLAASVFLVLYSIPKISGSESNAAGIAATVNGEKISENSVTAAIQQMRQNTNLLDESAWSSYLSTTGRTASDVRYDEIMKEAKTIIISQKCQELGYNVNDADIDSQIEQIRSAYGLEDEDAWQQFLSDNGQNDDSYRVLTSNNIEEQYIRNALTDTKAPTDAEILEIANTYGKSLNGEKRVSTIICNNEQDANDAIKRLSSGEAFQSVKSSLSNDAAGAFDGWTASTGVSEISNQLNSLSAGQVSQPIAMKNGTWCIAKCEETLSIPDGGYSSVSQIPDSLKKSFSEIASMSNTGQSYEDYIKGALDTADITINDMPKGLSYDTQ